MKPQNEARLRKKINTAGEYHLTHQHERNRHADSGTVRISDAQVERRASED